MRVVTPASVLKEGLERNEVPAHLHEGLIAYLREGYLPGHFLCCVLENDLSGAVMRADSTSINSLKALVNFLNMEAPSPAWGSPEKVKAWAKHCRRCVNSSTEPD